MKLNLRPGFAALLSVVGLMLSMPLAHADSITLSLANPHQSSITGGTFSFFATVSAPITNSGIENLNGDSFFVSSLATLDDSGYINNFPLFLNPGDSFTDLLFTISIPGAAKIQDYPGSFSIIGGSSPDSTDVLATAPFDVNVTPEP